MTLLIENLTQIVTLSGVAKKQGRRPTKKDLSLLTNGAILIQDKKILKIGKQSHVKLWKKKYSRLRTIDATGLVAFPGLIDPHTHLIFAGSRHEEFAWRCEGKKYLDIAKKGGGILSSVKATQKASLRTLITLGSQRIRKARSLGITTLEVKSGYGLSFADELKSLEAVRQLNKREKIRLVPTFLGAHAFPPLYRNRKDKYVDLLCSKMIPHIAQRKLASFCDVFIDPGFYNLSQTKRILSTAKKYRLNIRIHADEFKALGGTELAASLGAQSVDHLISVTRKGIRALAKAGTVATLLPGTSFFLGKRFAPARKLIDQGIAVALGTDFNPGTCVTQNLPLIATIAATQMKMTLPEVIAGITYNAAKSLNIHQEVGSLEVGKIADIALFEIPSYEYLPYHFGDNFCQGVIVSGQLL